MSGPGYVFKDGGIIPDDELQQQAASTEHTPDAGREPVRPAESSAAGSPISTPNSSKSGLPSNAPTESHALAEASHEEKGAAQEAHNEMEVKDLGWNEHPKDIPKPLVGGLPNSELWLLVRRFNKQMYHVKATPTAPLGGLDLNIADEDEFSPDKLRSNVERLYMTVIIGMMGFGKQIARLRSWREPRRTLAFAAAYFVAWVADYLAPLLFTTMVVLIAYPPARKIMFPPAPLALVNHKTGGIQSPAAGVLGSHDSVTGAPENHQGEAVEQEASNFVSGVATIALSSATGEHEAADPDSDPLNKSVPDPTHVAVASANAKASSAGGRPNKTHDKTKQPMEEAMWSKMRPAMHIIGDIADGWERFANALSPTAPFPKQTARLKLAGLLAPGVAVSLLTTSAMFVKMATFLIGVGFFSDPLMWRAAHWLNTKYPNWQKMLEVRNTILKSVPTNAQLTITLLRIGEANRAPLPPPPRSDEPPSSRPASLDGNDLTVDATDSELHDAIHADPNSPSTADDTEEKPKKRHGAKILSFLKGGTKAGVQTKFGTDRVRAAAGSEHAKMHLGVLVNNGDKATSGPVDFRARYRGRKGWVYINTSATVPCVSFSSHASDGTGEQSEKDPEPVFSIPIEDIKELKKIGGVGWKAKIVVGWATDKRGGDGIEIVEKNGGDWKLTAIPLREELFNRLVAMGSQRWESW